MLPYLFVIAINELSLHFQFELQNTNLFGITLGPDWPAIHSLLFADDLILCGHASLEEATTICRIFQDFSQLLGQGTNFLKSSILFSKKVDNHTNN